MGGLNQITNQILSLWRGSTPAARVGLLLLVVLCGGLIAGVGYWSMQPYYVMLASDVDAGVMKDLVAGLDRANIGYEIRGAGTVLMVDKRDWSRAMLVARESGVDGSATAPETLSPLDNPLNQQVIQRRNLERSLAASIGRFRGIERATVHLSLPERHPFLRQRDEPAASVVLTVRKSERFAATQAAAIASLVANAVEGLRPQRVTITDTDGNQYSAPEEQVAGLARQEDYRLQREQELASRAHAVLARYLGHENVVVRISADFDFQESDTEITRYDPDQKVVVSETIESETRTDRNDTALGGAGAVSNLGGQGSLTNSGPVTSSKRENTVSSYQTSTTVQKQRHRTPQLNLLTVSVVANATPLADKSGKVPPDLAARIESVVKQAVGFRDSRDVITVEFFPFADMVADSAPSASSIPWDQINEILRNVSLAVAALGALVVAFLLFRRLRPLGGGSAPASVAAPVSTRLEELGRMVQENPEVFSKIVSAWATAPSSASAVQTEDQSSSGRAAA